ncbi:MAG TPA: hypothetical protein VE136_05545 [Anaerolineales bacterium]|nr:hypothetical protein [Anaerolineales bacterium]
MNIKYPPSALSFGRILRTWWPLAASWMLMGAELPALSAVAARLPNPEINLAAYGGIVFPLALIVESPIIMLLAASTALSKDWESYRKIKGYMMLAGGFLTGLHILVAFTPLYYVVTEHILGSPPEIVEPARVGLMIMTPWTWSIAYRRFNQGVLIRFDHTKAVGIGTIVRLSADIIVLMIGYLSGTIPGIVVATCAVASGVISEAIYAGVVVRPVIRGELKPAPQVGEPLNLRSFLDFYIPLAMTSLMTLLVNPIGSAALSRMPAPLASLAVWPVVTGLVFMFRSMGMAYNEVVVALLDEPRSTKSLRRFTGLLFGLSTISLLMITATPLSELWFREVQGISPALTSLAVLGLWIALPMPGLNVLLSWFQGAILHGRRTRGISEAVGVFLITASLILWGGVIWGKTSGLYIGLAAFDVAMITQAIWLRRRSRPALRAAAERDEKLSALQTANASMD